MARQCFLRCIRSAWKRTTIVIPKCLTELPANRSYWLVSSTYFGHARSISQPARHKRELCCTHAPQSRRASTASSRSYAVTAAVYDDNRETITVTWDSGVTSEFPAVWLRDNCQCPHCFNESEIARNIVMSTLDVDVKPAELNVQNDGIEVRWSDGHLSSYDASWLQRRQFTEESRERQSRWSPRKPRIWDHARMQDKVPTDTFQRIMSDDRSLYDWLCTMEEDGIFFITDVTREDGILRDFCKRVVFLRNCNYGEISTIKSKTKASNIAYTSQTLGLHSDLPYYEYCPGIQMLLCRKQVTVIGGDNQFSDGFFVAERMRREFPEHFRVLTTTPVQFNDVGRDTYDYHLLQSIPTISLDDDGEVTRIAHNNQVRDSFFPVAVEQVNPWYRAIKLFDDLLYEHAITLKLQPGEMICFHNYRVLHGRIGYQESEDGERHLESCFMDWDELYSRRRVLQTTLGLDF